jgi:hypothetical protein
MLERRRSERQQLAQRPRGAADDLCDQGGLRLSVEGPPAGRHFVKDASEREDVGARVGRQSLELLGRHVLERPEDRPLLGERLGCGRLIRRRHRCRMRAPDPDHRVRLGETEIEKFRPGAREHHITGLEVAVDDTGAMRPVEGVGDLSAMSENFRQRKRPSCEAVGE